MTEQAIAIRPIKDGEKEALKLIMNSAFPFLMRLFFSFSKHILVAEKNGELIGGVILKMFFLPGKVKAGLVSLIFCSPAYSGLGVGQSLASEAVNQLEDKGCSEIFACVEGNNTSSSKLFFRNGFTRLSLMQQIRAYGLTNLLIWFHSFHLFDIGHFMWAKSNQEINSSKDNVPNSGLEWSITVISHVLIFTLCLWRQDGSNDISLGNTITILAVFSIFYIVRYGAMLTIAWIHNTKCEFRLWESGLFLSSMIALLFGGFMASPGSLYPLGDNWKYRDYIKQLGMMAFVSSVCLIGMVWGVGLLINFDLVPVNWQSHFETALAIGLGLLVLDVILPFFPFSSFNGRRLWDWNKSLWGVLSVSVIPLLVSQWY